MISCQSLRFAVHRLAHSLSSASSSVSTPSSAWINLTRSDLELALSNTKIDVERQFTDEKVQRLLAELTGMDLHNKVFRARRTEVQQRAHYALMTEERLEKTMNRMRDEARQFLRAVPFKEPRSDTSEVLVRDSEIEGFDDSRFVFTDITFDATDQDRAVVIREVDGTLRTATAEEHDRMNRVYYEKPHRPVNEPPLFADPWLQTALESDEHEFVMDWACWFFEPDDPSFVKLSRTVFDRTVEGGKLSVLHSTRHFATLVFYLAINGNIPPLLNWFGARGMLKEAASVVKLQKLIYPNWRVAVSSHDSDRKVVEDFVRQNERLKKSVPDLVAFLQSGKVAENVKKEGEPTKDKRHSHKSGGIVDASTVGSTAGPLGSIALEYNVKVSMGEEKGEVEGEKRKKSGKGVRGNIKHTHRKDDKGDS